MTQINTNTFAPDTRPAASHRPIPSLPGGSTVTVIGAGAFGGWCALYLQRKGFRVKLIDAWGGGNSRSSSGDETRVIRSTYGANETYFDLNVRALELWKENQKQFSNTVFFNTGVLWFCYHERSPLVDDSVPFSVKHGMHYEYLSPSTLRKKYPAVNTDDLHHAYFDPYGGYLKARESCAMVTTTFINEGGEYLIAEAIPGKFTAGRLEEIRLSTGTRIQSDVFLFACGAWLSTLFPGWLASQITCTKQEVYYFGVSAEAVKDFESFPVWVDLDGRDFYYGIPGNAHRGFKVGVDIRGGTFDPSNDDRILSPKVLEQARGFLAHRFPALKNAPLLESRVCPYENSADGNFIFDIHPQADNVLCLGGGSGHGFKHGPALGELVAQIMAGEKKAPDLFRIPEPL